MDNGSFVNDGFTYALTEYLNNKDNPEGVEFNSFYAVVIRLLTLIYDELDIVNPYYVNSPESLLKNLIKYGYNYGDAKNFFEMINHYFNGENEQDFINIQKTLVDMFIKKNQSVKLTRDDIQNFRIQLYSPYSGNPLRVSYNFMMTKKPYEVLDYFDRTLAQNPYKKPAVARETLNIEAYEVLKYSFDDVKNMDNEKLAKVNKQIYDYFDIDDRAVNKKYLLDQAVFDYNNPKPSFAGNGFISFIFFVSVLAAVGMIVLVITLIIS